MIAAVLGLVIGLSGCDLNSVFEVSDPDNVPDDAIRDETALPAVRASAIGDFAVAYVGTPGTEGQILTSGLLGDEFHHSGTFGTRREIDLRNIATTNATTQTVFRNLSRARVSGERAARIFAENAPGTAGHAESVNLAGMSYVLFGENYCSGVPFSEFTPEELVHGEPLTTAQIFERAAERFGESLGMEEAGERMVNLARVGMGRALLNLGRFEDAADAVVDVPTDFLYVTEHSDNSSRQNNAVWALNTNQRRWSIENVKGGNGLPYRDAADAGDPRVPVGQGQPGFDRRITQYPQLKYPGRTTDTPVASGVEARLIEAEAALRADDEAGFLQLHNELRASAGTDPAGAALLPPLTAEDLTGDLDDLHFEERAYWLWMTAHRLGDMRRLIRQYDRSADDIFAVGTYPYAGAGGGLPYGPDVNFPIPVDEENNPNFNQCLDRDA